MSSSRLYRLALFLIPLLVCSLPVSAAAQQATGAVSGVVRSSDGTPLRGVEVVLQGTDKSTLTTAAGEFLLTRVNPGSYQITARSIGYADANREIEVQGNRNTRLEIALSQSAVELSAITVLGTRRYGSNASASGLKFDANVMDVPQSVVVISQDFLDDQNATNLDDVLRNVGGITPFSDYQDVTARGFRQQDEDVTYNGVKANANNTFIAPNLHNVERVEVLKGPSSVLYGSGEGGAIINMVTKSPKAIAAQNFSVTYGTYNRLGGTADLTGPLAGEKLLYRVTAHYEDTEGFRRFEERTDWHFAPSLTWMPFQQTALTAKYELTGDSRRGHRNRGIGAPLGDLEALDVSWTANEPTDRAEQDAWTAELNLDQGLFSNWKLNVTARYADSEYINQYHESRGFACSIGGSVATCADRTNAAGVQGRLQMRREYRDQAFTWKTLAGTANANGTVKTGPISHRLLVNYDYTDKTKLLDPNDYASPADPIDVFDPVYGQVDLSSYPGRNPVNNPNTRDHRDWGVSAQDLITLIPSLKVLVGARHNNYRVFTQNYRTNNLDEHKRTATTYRGGVVWQPISSTSLYANISEGFKPQTSSQEDRGGPFEPLITRQREGGFKASLFQDRLIATTSIYRISKLNVLVPDPDTASNLLVTLGEVRSQGWEIDVIGSITSNWSVTANYANNDTKITEDPRPAQVGSRFPNAPRNSAGFWTRYDIPNWNFGAAIGASYVDERDTFDDTVLPSYTVFDGALFYDWRNYKLQLNVKNLFDERYYSGGYNNYQIWVGGPRTLQLTLRAAL